ncbi:MAG: F0F1 ATP synthase subunit B [Clostridiales Family XIII bacterium]|jgi:F-type H+-transporting ATPase subunit b|nr:F0F1 ATP synthase subunit B [Clostridiales Family XIII bacterium]
METGMETVAPLIGFNWTFVMVLVTFAVLYLILKKFFFEKVHDFMEAREQKVKDQFDNAEAAGKLAEEHLAEYKTKLEDVEIERRGVLKEAKALADQRAQQIVGEANERAAEIIRAAEKETERERAVAVEAMRDQVAMLALYAAEKIIEKQLDEKEQMLLIDDIIRQDGGEAWTH